MKVINRSPMVSKSAFCFALGVLFFALCLPVKAQQSGKIPRIGYASGGPGEDRFEAFRQGLRELGYTEGQNISIEYRDAGDRLDQMPALVNELVQQKVDLIVANNNVVIRAAKAATTTIPIVMTSTVDPVTAGYVESLAHPSGNITGIANLRRDLSGKRLELLKEAIPRLSRVAILWDAAGPGPKVAFKEYENTARTLKLHVQSLQVRGPQPAIDNAFQAAKRDHAGGLIIVSNPLTRKYSKHVLGLATKNRVPTMNEDSRYVDEGGLLSYGANTDDQFRRVAIYVEKILKGAKPADLPVEQPMKFELVINLKAAKQIGLTIPPNVLARADRVIR
jgi:ABC-type uncharacterized transport system substrate-binding protein